MYSLRHSRKVFFLSGSEETDIVRIDCIAFTVIFILCRNRIKSNWNKLSFLTAPKQKMVGMKINRFIGESAKKMLVQVTNF